MLRTTLLLGITCLAAGTSHASTCQWVGPNNGAWNNAANWSTKSVPTIKDSVVINAGKKVFVPANAAVANLTLGEGAEIRNGASLKVTGKTTSSGLFLGNGVLEVPVGAKATFNILPSVTLASLKSTNAPVVFAPVHNRGSIVTSVGRGSHVNFASLRNSGSIQITSAGTVAFKDIKNTAHLSIDSSGALSLGRIDNAKGASLRLAATQLIGRQLSNSNGDDSAAIHFDDLVNHPGGDVTLSGTKDGGYFDGDSISNAGEMQISGAQIFLESAVTNASGAKLGLDSGATLSSSDNSALQMSNAGELVKPAGSDATIQANWLNNGHVIVEEGTLHVQVPQGQACEQEGGITSVEGGVLSVEDLQGLSSNGTFEIKGGVVNGIGTIAGNVINSGGHFKPGHSPGTITINGSWTQTAGGVLDMELGGTSPGTGYDQMVINGTANFDGTLSITRWDEWMPQDGDVYTLFTYYSKTGNFAQFQDSTPIQGITYDTTLTPTDLELNCYATQVDTTAPTVAISTPSNGGAVRSLTTATGTASDAVGVTGVTCRLYRYANSVTGVAAGYWAGGSSWTTSTGTSNERAASGKNSWTFTLPTMVAGRYSLRATSKDTSGNTAAITISFWVDPNAPTSVAVTTPANGATISTLSQISGTASDAADGSGVTSVSYQLKRLSDNTYWNGSAWTTNAFSWPNTVSGTSWSRSTPALSSSTNMKPGNYSITATATDKAGNTKTVTTSFTMASGSSS